MIFRRTAGRSQRRIASVLLSTTTSAPVNATYVCCSKHAIRVSSASRSSGNSVNATNTATSSASQTLLQQGHPPPDGYLPPVGTTSTSTSPNSSNATNASSSSASSGGSAGSVWHVIREEFGKLIGWVRHDVSNVAAKSHATVTGHYANLFTDANLSPEEREKQKKKREAYEAVLRERQQATAASHAAATANMSWAQRLRYESAAAMEAMKQQTSQKAGVAALVQHCAAAHMAEVAVEQGVDVKNVQVVLEKQRQSSHAAVGVAEEERVVGYIDAPAASDEEVAAYVHRLQKACPAANMMQMRMEWRRAGSDTPIDFDIAYKKNQLHEQQQRDSSTSVLGGDRGGYKEAMATTASTNVGAEELIRPSIHDPMHKMSWDRRYRSQSSYNDASLSSSMAAGGFENPFAGLNIPKPVAAPSTAAPPSDLSNPPQATSSNLTEVPTDKSKP